MTEIYIENIQICQLLKRKPILLPPKQCFTKDCADMLQLKYKIWNNQMLIFCRKVIAYANFISEQWDCIQESIAVALKFPG